MLRKIAEIKVPKGAGPREAKTNPIFATYDRQGAAFAFYFSDSNIAGAVANLLFMVDGQKVFVDDGVTLGETNETHTFTYPLPDKLLNYTGKVDGYLYFDFEDGSHSDEIHFVFTIKKSQIDEEMEDAPDVYIKSFEDVKERVEQAGDSATKDIEKAKDNAKSQFGDYVGEVESAKDSTIEDIDKALPEVEDKLDEVAGKISELDISDRNLLKGTSDEWEERTFSTWTSDYIYVHLKDVGLQPGDVFTYAVDIDNTIDEVNTDEVKNSVTFRDSEDNLLGEASTNKISGGKKERAMSTAEIPEKTSVIRIAKFSKQEGEKQKTFAIRKRMLNCGARAAPWIPAPEDIALKSDIEQIKQAIIALGGSV